MSYRVAYTDDAKQDIKDILSYLAQFYASTARNFKKKLDKQVDSLKNMPLMYPAYEEDSFFRRMGLDDYVLFYNVDEKRQLVVIHHVWHAKREISRLMSECRAQE